MGTLARSDLTIALKEAGKRVAPAVKCGAQQQLTPRHRFHHVSISLPVPCEPRPSDTWRYLDTDLIETLRCHFLKFYPSGRVAQTLSHLSNSAKLLMH
jgi:hypothetical protein